MTDDATSAANGDQWLFAVDDTFEKYWARNDPPHIQNAGNPIVCMRCGERGHVRPECLRFRTRMCIHFQNGSCHDGKYCSFAHSESELRDPCQKRCVRVVVAGECSDDDCVAVVRERHGDIIILGCGTVGRTFSECCYRPAPMSATAAAHGDIVGCDAGADIGCDAGADTPPNTASTPTIVATAMTASAIVSTASPNADFSLAPE